MDHPIIMHLKYVTAIFAEEPIKDTPYLTQEGEV